MKPNSNRGACGLAAILTVVALSGFGVMLLRGVFLGNVGVKLYPPVPVRVDDAVAGGDGVWRVARHYDLRVCLAEVVRTYVQQEPPPEASEEFGLK
jgi:hypothetical protein